MVDRFGSWRWIAGLLAAWVLQGVTPSVWAAPGALQVNPSVVDMDIFYGGVDLTVKGEVPRGCDAVIAILGRTSKEDLMRKGKRLELWMNVGEVVVRGAPNLYLLRSNSLSAVADVDLEAQWGYRALKKQITFSTKLKVSHGDELFHEFIRLKESQEVYGVYPHGVTITPAGPGRNTAQAVFPIPTRVVPGTYRVYLFAVRDGLVVQRQSVPLQVRVVGLPAFLDSFARNHALLYGVMAVLIAMGAGLLSGVIFKKKGGHH